MCAGILGRQLGGRFMYKVNDYIVYGATGVCRIENVVRETGKIRRRQKPGQVRQRYYAIC
ncbi:MAG: CarD family transcriptional regulator [Negativicutes bacterium]